MTHYIYEKDLFGMKYNILVSKLHDETVGEISDRLSINKQDLRKFFIENLDMSYLENIPARYSSWLCAEEEDDISKELCFRLFTKHIPVFDEEKMSDICRTVGENIKSGTPRDEAINGGKEIIREMILK